MDPLTIRIADLEVELDEIDTRRLDLPVDAVAERITLRQTQRELELEIARLRAQSPVDVLERDEIEDLSIDLTLAEPVLADETAEDSAG